MAVVYFAGRAIDLRGPPRTRSPSRPRCSSPPQPLAIADPAFLLTFGATAAILVVIDDGHRPARTPRVLARRPPLIFASSIAAEAALMPVGAALFSRVTFAGLALNFVGDSADGGRPDCRHGASSSSLPSLSRLAAAAGWLAHVGADGLVRSADLVEWLPWLRGGSRRRIGSRSPSYYGARAVLVLGGPSDGARSAGRPRFERLSAARR